MGLKACADCGKSISTWAIECPHCGRYMLPQCGECYYYESDIRRCRKYSDKNNKRANSPACGGFENKD
jgi:hypothetical protein